MDYFQQEDFSRDVYYIKSYVESYGIQCCTLEELVRECAETTTTPQGVDYAYFVNEATLYRWVGSESMPVFTFDNNEDAVHALLLTFKYDLDNSECAPEYFDRHEDAEEYLINLIE